MISNAPFSRRCIAHASAAGLLFLCATIAYYPPTASSLYPSCPIHQLLGIECPGCGSTRTLAALLHGHLQEALHLNALFVLMLPAMLAFAISIYRRALQPGSFQWPRIPARATYATLAAAVVFTLARNIIH